MIEPVKEVEVKDDNGNTLKVRAWFKLIKTRSLDDIENNHDAIQSIEIDDRIIHKSNSLDGGFFDSQTGITYTIIE